jgi:SpoVK/Ycf46/Vps4 family AAA+-type ATPase
MVAAVTDRGGDGLARPIVPRRRAGDLVLPEPQHRQLAEVSAACLTWPRIAESWRSPGAGVKVLFTGEPGTGKTLAAEVVAGTLGLLLLKVDLSRVVSKWVGETEKNLESTFRQAEESQAVLFFDEADALFGKRGDVRQGIDRYANLEVGFLLQRLEQSDAIVVLASNLRDQVDAAFTRRFHYIVNFPRPGAEEREKIWRTVFPPGTPLAGDLDPAALASLDMTGASISGAARTAALLATDRGDPSITMAHVVQAVRRQYDRDSRLLNPADLGRFACLAELR